MQRFGTQQAGQEAPWASSTPLKKGKGKKRRRTPGVAARSGTPIEPTASATLEVLQRTRQELQSLDQKIGDLDRQLRVLRLRRVAVVAALQKLVGRGKALAPPRLVAKAEAAALRPRRKRPSSQPGPGKAARST
jgi:hypothetical protein